jgi:hypothetical protein
MSHEIIYLEQFDSHSFEIRNDLNTRTLCTQGGRVTTSTRVHAGNHGAERWTKRIAWSRVVHIGAHDDLPSEKGRLGWKQSVSQRRKAYDEVEDRRWHLQAWR